MNYQIIDHKQKIPTKTMNDHNLDVQIKEKALKILRVTDGNLCARCLGRNFSQDIEASDNLVRGEYISKNLYETGDKNCTINDCSNNVKCFICDGLFRKINNELIEYVFNKLKYLNIKFKTFLVGCRVNKDIIQREQEIHETIHVEVENIKKEINREIGKALSIKLDKEVDFEYPDLVILVDFTKDREKPQLEFQINPIFIEGRYRKLVRGIPQTKWPCRECKGKGCKRCNYTGKMYQESVEEFISPEVLKESQGSDTKFHGAGREDIDVKMLGTGRPFVLEIKEPRKRSLDLKELEDKINYSAAGKVEVSGLKYVNKIRRKEIKTSSTDTYKVYRAKVRLENEVTLEDLDLIKSLKVIEQRTPKRVVHRRADIIRKRQIRNIEIKKLKEGCLELIIECQGGLYIKEFISGDDDRTRPSISSLMETEAQCVQLDVLNVHIT